MSVAGLMKVSASRSSDESRGRGCTPSAPETVDGGYDDLYEGYNICVDTNSISYGGRGERVSQSHQTFGSKSEVPTTSKPECFAAAYEPVAVFHSQTSSMSENQGAKFEAYNVRTPTPNVILASMWRPPSTGRTTRAPSMISLAQAEPSTRPMTAVTSAGYSSRGSKFDPLNQGARKMTPAGPKKEEANPEYQSREMERLVNQLLEESATAGLAGDHQLALEKAKEAGRRERLLCKHREQAGLIDQINLELTFAVCFNLGFQYHANGLHPEALCTYSQIIKNKQFMQGGRLRVNMGNVYYEQKKYTLAVKMYRMALDQTPNTHKEIRYRIMRNIGNALMRLGRYQDAVHSYEAVIEIKVDHQACYNLMVCYYILGHLEKTKSVFTKMLIVRHYDSDDETGDIDGDHSAVLRNDVLKEELRSKQSHAFKYILTAARLIAPVLGNTFVEGYDCLISMLKDQQYVALANEMEMDKALQHIRRQDFVQAISLLKNFERKERDLKARAATNLSFLYFLEGDHANAEKHAELAVKTNTYNPCALVNHGNCLYLKGDVEGALARYKEALEVEADCVEAIFNIGLSQKRLDCLGDALHTFRKLSNLLPHNVEVLFQIGHLYELLGNYQEAIKWLEIVNTRVMHDAGVLAMLGNLHTKLDDEPKAVHYYYESHRVYPTNMDIISWLGAFYVKSEVYEKAMPFFELASKIQPAEVKWQLMVASCFRRTGQYKLALAKYKSILAKHPENVECLRYLVHMCTSLGRKEELLQYEQRLRRTERSVSRALTGDSKSQFARTEEVESGGLSIYQQQQQNEVQARICQDSKRGHTPERFSSHVPTETSSQQSTIPRMLTARKSGNYEEEWPDLEDDLLPL